MNEPAEVKDLVAENRIRWGVIAQGLILITVAGLGSTFIALGINFSDRVIVGIDKLNERVGAGTEKLNESLVEIREEISHANTRGKINGSRLDKHEKDISQNTQDIKTLYSTRE